MIAKWNFSYMQPEDPLACRGLVKAVWLARRSDPEGGVSLMQGCVSLPGNSQDRQRKRRKLLGQGRYLETVYEY